MKFVLIVFCCTLCAGECAGGSKQPEPSPLERYVEDATTRSDASRQVSPGSIWSPSANMMDLARDLRASQVDDLVTILVTERASATASGTVKTARSSKAAYSVTAAGGLTAAAGPLVNLAGASGDQTLDGQGSTSRATMLSTTLTARVTQVLPNGNLVLEGIKDVQVNSERQSVTVRGVVRPVDLSPDNIIRSDRIAQMEIRINGKGVVGDAVRRPFILYRILLGLLPF